MELEFFDKIIQNVKEIGKPGDLPMAWFKNKKDEVIVSAIATGKSSMKLAIYALQKMHDAKEVIIAIEAWYVEEPKEMGKNLKEVEKNMKVAVRNHPKRKECFIVCYFSPEKELIQHLPFTKKKKGKKEICVWGDIPKYQDLTNVESKFNPWKMSPEEIEQYRLDMEIEVIKVNGKKEEHAMKFGYKFVVYRHEGKAYFECLKADGEPFMQIKPQKDDENFQKAIDKAFEMLRSVGGMP